MGMKKILVTGAAGFIGFHVSKKLVALGYDVVGVDNLLPYYDVNLKKARLLEMGVVSGSIGNKDNNAVLVDLGNGKHHIITKHDIISTF